MSERDGKIKAVLTAYGASADEIQAGSLQRRSRQPIDWTLVAQLAEIPCSIIEIARALGMSEPTLRRAIRLWPEHAHLFARGAP
jgi:hypothetical protein